MSFMEYEPSCLSHIRAPRRASTPIHAKFSPRAIFRGFSPFYAFLSSLSIGEYTDLLPSDFFATRTATPLVISLVSYECISMLGFYFRFAIRERGHLLSRGLFNPVGLVALALAFKRPFPSTSSGLSPTFKRSIPYLQPTYPLAFKRLIASPSAHAIPHHPDQMTLQSYCASRSLTLLTAFVRLLLLYIYLYIYIYIYFYFYFNIYFRH
ncbi:hypothetical protein EV122DRAFT_285286 [Schizophyllum commune]